jgi:hypothetical protein
MWLSGSVCTPKTRSTPRTSQRTAPTTGENTRTTRPITDATREAAGSALVMA